MSKKRQIAILDPRGMARAQITTLAYDYAHGHVVAPHFHQQGQILFASRGAMILRTERESWVVPPLRAVWIPTEEIHSIAMAGAVSMRTLYFAPSLARAMSRRCFVFNVSPLLRELILHACTRKGWKTRAPRERRVIELLLDQLKDAAAIPVHLPHPTDPRADRVLQILIGDPGDSRTLDKLCREAGGSKRTIERLFAKETGMTFGKWRQQLRLLHGMRLLAAGENVTAAALESGYSSPSAFISVFKKALGTTPHRYLQS